MSRHRLEVAAVIHQHEGELLKRWGHRLSSRQRKTLRDIGSCRSAAQGAHIEQCDSCSAERIAYNSCCNRHCPKCQSAARDRWLAARAKELLPVRYCHVVFTVPRALAARRRLALPRPASFCGADSPVFEDFLASTHQSNPGDPSPVRLTKGPPPAVRRLEWTRKARPVEKGQ